MLIVLKEPGLPGLEQVRSHADGWRILDVLNVLRVLRNDLVVHGCRGVLRDEASQKTFDVRTGLEITEIIPRLAWKTNNIVANRTCSEWVEEQTCRRCRQTNATRLA
jgi:hypothetical protein